MESSGMRSCPDGTAGAPKKTLPKGVRVRLKNKGSQAHKRGPKRKKYQAPCAEHPDTVKYIADKDIQANRLEGTNAGTRRCYSPFRRRTNTYAKSVEGLQRVLDCQWVYLNFSRRHFTTKIVPAVGLGYSIKALLGLQIMG